MSSEPSSIRGLSDALLQRIKSGVPLAPHTTMGVGGPAEWLIEAESAAEITELETACRATGTPCLLLGSGSNVVVSDAGLAGLVVLNRDRRVLVFGEREVRVAAGVVLADLVQSAVTHGLTGIEFAAGIPGTVGGAVVGNAGAYGSCVGDILLDALVLLPGTGPRRMTRGELGFSYRESNLKQEGWILLEAGFALQPDDPAAIRSRVDEILATRAAKLPTDATRCAGSVFKNLPPLEGQTRRRASGKLLDQAGCKGLSEGGAGVFPRHANIIVNNGHASAADVWRLTMMMRDRVMQLHGVELEPEVRFLGEFPPE